MAKNNANVKHTRRVKDDPGQTAYFFGESYVQLWETLTAAWEKNGEKIKDSFFGIGEVWGDSNVYTAICLSIFKLAILISVAVFGTIFTAVFSLIHIVFLLILSLLVYLGFVLLRGINAIYSVMRGIGTNCYNSECQRKFTLPVYVCPRCKAKHYKLVPSKFGILKRKCTCGALLPTTFINGRQKLESLCPHCEHSAIKGANKNLLIPVIGGVAAGKTTFITFAINQIEKQAPSYKLHYEYVQGDEMKDNLGRVQSGAWPKKTGQHSLKYYNFYLSPEKSKIKTLVSVCDISGEVFARQSDLVKQQGYRFADGLLLVVDPLSIVEFKREIKKQLAEEEFDKFNASTQSMNDVLSGLINTLEGLHHMNAKDSLKKSIVIVFTKNDIPGLEERIGESAIQEYLRANPTKDYCTASNVLCEQFLMDYAEDSFLHTVKGKFAHVQFFSCSALNGDEKKNGFAPKNMEKPLLWLIDKASKDMNVSSLWGKKI